MKEVLLQSLEVAWKGMLSIFVAIGIIFLAIVIVNKVNNYMDKRAAKQDEK